MTPQDCHTQIRVLIERMIQSGLSVQQIMPNIRTCQEGRVEVGTNISISSFSLRNVAYKEIYRDIEANSGYHVKLIDGGLLIFQYEFTQNNDLLKHRLAYFPPPDLPTLEEAPALYENDELYAEVMEHRIVRFPIRFDFDPKNYRDVYHPKSHMTLGQYSKCRIPVSNPVRPKPFLTFVLRNFYHQAFIRNLNLFEKHIVGTSIAECISDMERTIPHLVVT